MPLLAEDLIMPQGGWRTRGSRALQRENSGCARHVSELGLIEKYQADFLYAGVFAKRLILRSEYRAGDSFQWIAVAPGENGRERQVFQSAMNGWFEADVITVVEQHRMLVLMLSENRPPLKTSFS
jgi:hypothetical protein